MKKNLHYLALSILLISCSRPQDTTGYFDFSTLPTLELQTKRINQDEIISRGAYPFAKIDSAFLLFNGIPSYGALVLRESDAKEVGHFLVKGNGPGECINPLYMGHRNDTIFVCEGSVTRKMTYTYAFENDSLRYRFVSEVRPQRNDDFYTKVVQLDNGLAVGLRLSGKQHLFSLLDERLDTLKTFGALPIPYGGSTLRYFNGELVADSNTVYFAGNYFTHLAAYEVRGQEVVPKFDRLYVAPSYEDQGERIKLKKESHQRGFYDLCLYKDYILATYSGKTLVKQEVEGPDALMPTCVIVFDRDGHPLARLDTSLKIRSLIPTDDHLYFLDLDCNIEAVDMHEVLRFIEEHV